MKKKSSYQKLKDRNKELEIDIMELVLRPESMNANEIKSLYEMKYSLNDCVY